MGWNTVEPPEESRMFDGITDERFYFVHSYGVRDWVLQATPPFPVPSVTWTDYDASSQRPGTRMICIPRT